MARKQCQVCGQPATVRVEANLNGRHSTMLLCDDHYRQLVRQQKRTVSPLEALFGSRSGLFEDFLGSDFFRIGDDATPVAADTDDVVDASFGEPAAAGSGAPRRRGSGLASRISEQSEALLQEAAKHAAEFGRSEVDTEHLLLALADSDVVKTILGQFKIKVDDLKRQIESEAKRGDKPFEGEIGVSPRVKDALSRAFLASNELGHSYVGPEHFLIGLAEEGEGLAANLLRRYGLTPQALRQQVSKVVGKGAEDGRAETPTNTPELDKYSRDLTKMARDGKLDPVIGRAQEIETTIEVLARRKKNNPVLIGEPGVGKTAIVEGLALRMAADEVPATIRGKRLYSLDVSSLLAGTKYRGEFEERMQRLLEELRRKQDSILFIDEIHTIAGAGSTQGSLDTANILKPALARGELQVIGATTLDEYREDIESDPALERRFQKILVEPASEEETLQILHNIAPHYERHHGVRYSDEALRACVALTGRYITDRNFPDKAIDVLDEAGARIHLQDKGKTEKPSRKTASREPVGAAAGAKTPKNRSRKTAAADTTTVGGAVWTLPSDPGPPEIRAEHIEQVITSMTGIPAERLSGSESERLRGLADYLSARVIGQCEAVEKISRSIQRSRAGLKDEGRPIGVFMFVGPTGVGKTLLAKELSKWLFDENKGLIRIDMSEYSEKHNVARLIGSPPGYVGYGEGGQLTEAVRRHPYSVVLFDEIEKAHPEVFNTLLQIFDEGHLTDGSGRKVDFRNTVIILTSNVGSRAAAIRSTQVGYSTCSKSDTQQKAPQSEYRRALEETFAPEFLNRIDDIVIFRTLDLSDVERIIDLELKGLLSRTDRLGYKVEITDEAKRTLAAIGYQRKYGVRALRRTLLERIEEPLSGLIIDGKLHSGERVIVEPDGEKEVILRVA